jgi:hypothetical protein
MLIEPSENHLDFATGFAPTPAIKSRIAYQQTVERELTHKRYLENVYITALDRLAPREFLAGAYIPRANTYINSMRGDSNDVTIPVVEIGRQIGMAVAHKFLGVGYGNAFILSDLQFDFSPLAHEINWRAQETLLAHSVLTESANHENGELAQVGGYINFYVDDQCVFRQSSSYTIQDRARYTKLRDLMRARYERTRKNYREAEKPAGSLEPLRSNCSVLADQLFIAEDGNTVTATLLVDRSNLFFFDHDNDHIPGMLIHEGMRQLVVEICSRSGSAQAAQLARMNLEFCIFAELDTPLSLVATITRKPNDATAPAAISIEARQLEKIVSKGVFSLR